MLAIRDIKAATAFYRDLIGAGVALDIGSRVVFSQETRLASCDTSLGV